MQNTSHDITINNNVQFPVKVGADGPKIANKIEVYDLLIEVHPCAMNIYKCKGRNVLLSAINIRVSGEQY